MNKDDTNLNSVIESLREEILVRGELLLLQQELPDIIEHKQDVAKVKAYGTEGFGLMRKLTELRQASEQAKLTMVTQMGLPQETKFNQMINQLPKEYRPLLEALRDENDDLGGKLDMWLKYNAQLMKRSNLLIENIMQHAPPQTSDMSGLYGAGTQAAPGCVVDLYGRPSPKGTLYEGVI